LVYFLTKEKVLQEEIGWAEKELDYYRASGEASRNIGTKSPSEKMRFGNRITLYNKLQEQRDSLILKTLKDYPDLCATKLIKMYREPFLDGNLNRQERDKLFKSTYFNNLDFADESLMNSDVYTKKVFKYLMSFAQRGLTQEQQEQEFKNAIDIIAAHTNKNEKVYEFILDYLVSGFEKLRLNNLLTYIADKYSGTTCQTDEVTTFERKLLQQKMKVGTVVPDFTMNDLNRDSVNLSVVLKEKNLILFWASWCPHCNEMIPEILNWQKSSSLTDFEVIAISLDNEETEWKEKVFEMGIEGWYNVSDLKKWEGEVVKDYNVYATPTMFIIDKNQQILSKPITLKEFYSFFSK
jgi:thiol-disulfide isomerase/thioredoxin